MIPEFVERYLIEIILLVGFFSAGPLAQSLADSCTEETAEERYLSFISLRSLFRGLFAGLIALWLLLFKTLLPLL